MRSVRYSTASTGTSSSSHCNSLAILVVQARRMMMTSPSRIEVSSSNTHSRAATSASSSSAASSPSSSSFLRGRMFASQLNSGSFGSAGLAALGSFTTSRRFQHARPSFGDIGKACKTLDCRVDAEPKKLKKMYLELVKKYHPDKKGGSEEKMKEISTAYTCVKSLSQSERTAFQNQHSGRGYTSSGRPAEHQTRPGASYANQKSTSSQYAAGSAGAAWSGAAGANKPGTRAAYDWQRMYEEQQKATQFKYGSDFKRGHHNQSRNQTEHGTNMKAVNNSLLMVFQRLIRMPAMQFARRMLLTYVIITIALSILYRRRQNHEENKGWEMSDSVNKRERLEDLLKMREDVLDRVGNTSYVGRMAAEREKEKRVMEWASLKQKEMAELQRCGFGSFHPSLGYLHRKPDEPEGVVYYEPRSNEAAYQPAGASNPSEVMPAQGAQQGGGQIPQGGHIPLTPITPNQGFVSRRGPAGQPMEAGQRQGTLNPAILSSNDMPAAPPLQATQASPTGTYSSRNQKLLQERQQAQGQLPPGYPPTAGHLSQPPQQPQRFLRTTPPATAEAQKNNNKSFFPKSAEEQLQDIQSRTRFPDGQGTQPLHDLPAGTRRAMASPTGAAYPDLPPGMLGIKPGSMSAGQTPPGIASFRADGGNVRAGGMSAPGPVDEYDNLPPPVSGSTQTRAAKPANNNNYYGEQNYGHDNDVSAQNRSMQRGMGQRF